MGNFLYAEDRQTVTREGSMPRDQDKVPYLGRQSGKSSNKWFRNSSGTGADLHPRGNGASAGDGKTSDASILDKIIPEFLRGNR